MASKAASWVIVAGLVGLLLGWEVGHSGLGSSSVGSGSVRYQALVMPASSTSVGSLYIVDTYTGDCRFRPDGNGAWVDIGPMPDNRSQSEK